MTGASVDIRLSSDNIPHLEITFTPIEMDKGDLDMLHYFIEISGDNQKYFIGMAADSFHKLSIPLHQLPSEFWQQDSENFDIDKLPKIFKTFQRTFKFYPIQKSQNNETAT